MVHLRILVFRVARLFIYMFAFFGVVDLAGRIVIAPFSGRFFDHALGLPLDFEKPEVIFSDDRSYKAVIYVWAGPAFDAGCDKMVAAIDAGASVDTSWARDNIVYRAGCDAFFHVGWEPAADGRVKPRLRIQADAGKGDFMSRFAMDGRVAVAYEGGP